ncbi:MAG TPA: hypothetical protein VEG84_07980 [Thermoanaerobaculia bacterium]|nr:hypothetical protein [Thermoanaerobaculia bacterium]
MAQMFSKVAGIVQLILGLVGQFAPGVASSLGTGSGSNIFNIVSGGILSYLGTKGTESGQRTGAQVLGGLNGLVGVLGALGVNNVAGLTMNQGMAGNIINLLIGAWGLYAGFGAKKTAAA